MKFTEFLKKYTFSLVSLVLALIVIFFVLDLLHNRLPGPVGNVADVIGKRASGQAYTY
jgi:hypothetical protein